MHELLVPVGTMESLKIAIHSGADAVYLGGKKFGARAYANNFTEEEMISAIKLCHLYGVKIYVTVNTMIFEAEIAEVLNYVEFLYDNYVDAVIMQDYGLIDLAHKKFPNLEIHASTQAHNVSENGIKFLENLGVKRVVFARELSLEEIKEIKTPLEKEAFIHGALCISYSGECLFSSLVMGRSGNRGECAQMCRLPFSLIKNTETISTPGQYLLSTKELNTSDSFQDILSSDIISYKIEGRMKSPEYVGSVTKLYRDLIDKHVHHQKVEVDSEILNDLRVIFNREYTRGFLFNSSNAELMNIKSSNHVGIPLGKVTNVNSKYIEIKLDNDLHQGDGIRFNKLGEGMIINYLYDTKNMLINHAPSGSIVKIDNKFSVAINDSINKTYDSLIAKKYLHPEEKKVLIDIKVEAYLNDNFKIIFSDGKNLVCNSSSLVCASKTSPITKEKISEQVSKLGNTPFKVNNIDIKMDENVFISIKEINDLRRLCAQELEEKRSNYEKEIIKETINEEIISSYEGDIVLAVLVRNEEQLSAALDKNIKRIYIVDRTLYKKYMHLENVYFRTSRVGEEIDTKVLATEIGSLNNKKSVVDYYCNVANHASINLLGKYASVITLSAELSFDQIKDIMEYYDYSIPVEKIIYGRYELMLTKYCPINMLANNNSPCHACLNDSFCLMDRNQKKYPIISNPENHLTHILNYKKSNLIMDIPNYIDIGIKNFRLELFDENYDEVISIIDEVNIKIGN